MTAKLLRISEHQPGLFQEISDITSGLAPLEQPSVGWDPYEVWRTRVLMPRLQDRETSNGESGQLGDTHSSSSSQFPKLAKV